MAAPPSVKQKSMEQRWPIAEEPRCVVCGRYGEYIIDETDEDVCSLACKAKRLQTAASSATPVPPAAAAVPTEPPIPAEHIRAAFDIHTETADVPPPLLSFDSLPFAERLAACGYSTPTPVQMQAIPIALSGRDLIVAAPTGSGKSLAFLLPAMVAAQRTAAQAGSLPLTALVLSPTRELCLQLYEAAKALTQDTPLTTAVLVGGLSIKPQMHLLKRGVSIVIATPGRLADVLKQLDGEVSLRSVTYLVLDEADALLQMGFETEVREIAAQTSPRRQTLLFSATLSPRVRQLASSLLAASPASVSVSAASAVKQTVLWVPNAHKKQRLFELLRDKEVFTPPAVVFVSSRLGCELLSDAIKKVTNIECAAIHGEMTQAERTAALALSAPILVSTPLLARGLVLPAVRQVILFDMPPSLAEYTHMIGRASRLGSSGWAIAFVCEDDQRMLRDLVRHLRATSSVVPPEVLRRVPDEQEEKSTHTSADGNRAQKRGAEAGVDLQARAAEAWQRELRRLQ